MSGSPPPELPRELSREPQQIAGRRRRRSDTPPTTTALSVASPPTPLEQTAPRLLAQGRGGQTYGGVAIPPATYGSTYPTTQQYYSGATVSAGPVGPQASQFGAVETSPRATRKTKAHVASACKNCKKKHLRCDENRPCRRCVQHGKEDSCVDVEHKKRGRPPLKPDDPSTRRPFESALSPLSGQTSESNRGMLSGDASSYTQPSGLQRNFRPLQAVPPYDPTRPQLRQGPPLPPMYGQPTISASPTTAMGTFIPSSLNYPSNLGVTSALQPSAYLSSGTEGLSRFQQPYGDRYSYPPAPSMSAQGQMRPPSNLYANPIFPRTTIPPAGQIDPLGLPGPSSLQLPPIRPAPQASLDPAFVQQQQQQHPQRSPQRSQVSQEQTTSSEGSTRPPDSKRPKMDIQGILGPKSD